MCDTLVSITDDGVLFAKNSDRDPNEAQLLHRVPAAVHAAGTRLRATWIEIPQVERTNAVLLSRPWWMWGAEMGANEHGLVIGNQAVFTRGRVAAEGLLGMDLVRLGLERAATAEAAAQVIVALLEEHGQGGSCSHEHPGFRYHNSFLLADGDGAIVLETAGREWATETVRGRGRSISNALTIEAFAKCHSDPVRSAVASARLRRNRTQESACGAGGVADLFAALRDHGPTGTPRWSMVNGALSAPCAHAGGLVTATQTTASWVSDLRPGARTTHWVTGTGAPCTSLYKPIAVEGPETDHVDGPDATNRYDEEVGWWRHEVLHRLVLRDHPASIARFIDERDRIERRWLDEPPSTDDAFDEATRVADAWLLDLTDARLPDRRALWLRRRWAAWDAASGLADAASVRRPKTVAGAAR